MFKNELILLELENKNQYLELQEDDKHIINDIMKSMSIFKVNSYDAQVIKRDLIGMAQELNLRNSNLKDSIGDDLKGFTDEIIKNSDGPNIIEIVLGFLIKLSGYFFIWYLLSALLGLSFESNHIVIPFYIGVVIIAFIVENLITPLFSTETGFKKNLQSLISLIMIIIWTIIIYLLKGSQHNVEVNGLAVIIVSGLVYLITRYLNSLNIRKLAQGKHNFIEDLK